MITCSGTTCPGYFVHFLLNPGFTDNCGFVCFVKLPNKTSDSGRVEIQWERYTQIHTLELWPKGAEPGCTLLSPRLHRGAPPKSAPSLVPFVTLMPVHPTYSPSSCTQMFSTKVHPPRPPIECTLCVECQSAPYNSQLHPPCPTPECTLCRQMPKCTPLCRSAPSFPKTKCTLCAKVHPLSQGQSAPSLPSPQHSISEPPILQ